MRPYFKYLFKVVNISFFKQFVNEATVYKTQIFALEKFTRNVFSSKHTLVLVFILLRISIFFAGYTLVLFLPSYFILLLFLGGVDDEIC